LENATVSTPFGAFFALTASTSNLLNGSPLPCAAREAKGLIGASSTNSHRNRKSTQR